MSAAGTTRRYPRTTAEAFPGSVDYACAVTRSSGAASIGRLTGQALALALLLLLAAGVWSWTQTPPTESATLADASAQAQRQVRFEKAARAMCGKNSDWADLGNGTVQCRTKRGRKTTVAQVAP